jgi:hypothetical protein
MCFSASASITAGVLLTFIGTETVRKVHKPAQIIFASIPLFFALQQFAEGVIWLFMGRTGYESLLAVVTYIFVFMAQVLWPVMIPLSVLLIEENRIKKRILAALFAAGSAIGLYNLYLLAAHGIHAGISGMHITYQSNFDDNFSKLALACYLLVTVAPLFVSGIKRMYILGIIMALSFAVSAVFYMQCLTSVWCFFAAVISFVVYYIIRRAHNQFYFDSVQGQAR